MKFFTSRHVPAGWLIIATFGLISSIALSTAVQAEEETLSVYLFKNNANGSIQYSKDPSRNSRALTATQYEAENRYICTPSGFGQKSRCYVRNSRSLLVSSSSQ